MKNMRIPLLIAWGVAVLGLVLGSLFDLNISTAIANPNNAFGLVVSILGPTLGFATVSAMGGGFIAFALKKEYKTILRVFFCACAVACFGVSVYFSGGEFFGINGFYGSVPEWVGYLIALVPQGGALVGGYFLFRNTKNKNLWIVFLGIMALLVLVLVAGVTVFKGILHRPRYRLIMGGQVEFYNWWQRCSNYKDLIAQYGIDPDNFKSFPSGHTCETSALLVAVTFLPLADEKFKKWQLPLFICSFAFLLLVAFARILVGAHFLSDVSFGALLTLTVLFIANEVVMRIKPLHIENQAPAGEQE